jgi:hypothetical protein
VVVLDGAAVDFADLGAGETDGLHRADGTASVHAH